MIRRLLFKVWCVRFGHIMQQTKNDQVRCAVCHRVYYKVPGE